MIPGERIRVSVVVACRNESQHIREFLDSLARQELGEIDMDVVIADGMSADGTREVLDEYEKRHPALKVIANPKKIASTGLNRAICESRGEIVIRMDAHTAYAANYVGSCVEVLQESGADNVGGPALAEGDGYWQQAIAHAFHTPFASGGAKFRDPRYEGPVDTVPYGCWRRSTLEQIGLFDESQVRGQDDELNRRLLAQGGTVWQSPRIVSWYRPRASLPALFSQYFQYGFWKVAVTRKHPGRLRWRNLVPVSCLFAATFVLLAAAAASAAGQPAWRNAFLYSLCVLSGLYFAASLAVAFCVALRKGWMFLPSLPIVFGTYQLSYALGFTVGLFVHTATRGLPHLSGETHAAESG
jgi:succinoglycan biosynthesis protein ExoA